MLLDFLNIALADLLNLGISILPMLLQLGSILVLNLVSFAGISMGLVLGLRIVQGSLRRVLLATGLVKKD